MSESEAGSESGQTDADTADQSESDDRKEPLDEDDHALGRTSQPDVAEREEQESAGQDYAGSGF